MNWFKVQTAFQLSKAHTPQTILNVRSLDASNTQQRHEKEPLQLAGCENRWWRKEGAFQGHPVKREGHGWSSITAGVRKRQRFRVVRRRAVEVRDTVDYSTSGPRNPGLTSAALQASSLLTDFWTAGSFSSLTYWRVILYIQGCLLTDVKRKIFDRTCF